jgi:hypothetical protein
LDVIPLYDLSHRMVAVLDALSGNGGELTPEVEALLAEMEVEGEDRVVQLALACDELKRSAVAIEGAEFRLRDRKRAVRAVETRLREAILDFMVQAGTPRVKHDLVTVSLVEGEVRPIWDGKDENIPEPFRRTLVEHRLDADAVLRARADGHEFPADMRFVPSRHIRIL